MFFFSPLSVKSSTGVLFFFSHLFSFFNNQLVSVQAQDGVEEEEGKGKTPSRDRSFFNFIKKKNWPSLRAKLSRGASYLLKAPVLFLQAGAQVLHAHMHSLLYAVPFFAQNAASSSWTGMSGVGGGRMQRWSADTLRAKRRMWRRERRDNVRQRRPP